MSVDKPLPKADGDQATSTGVPWSEVPEFARHHVVWIDGRHGSAQASLPPVEVEPNPEILYRLAMGKALKSNNDKGGAT